MRIYNDGSVLKIEVPIPEDLAGKPNRVYNLALEMGGGEIATKALAERLQENLSKTIQAIRKEAYEQGAKDRSNKATQFSDNFRSVAHKGGCW